MDSGVVPGSIISQYYDPMISKLIAHSPHNRLEAIDALKGALDRYVIKGIAHNTSFLSSVLRNQDFIDGSTPTNFIDLHYPDGFTGVELNNEEHAEFVAVAAVVNMWKKEYLHTASITLNSNDSNGSEELVVCIGGMFGKAFIVNIDDDKIKVRHILRKRISNDDNADSIIDNNEEATSMSMAEHIVKIDSVEYDPINPVVNVSINGVKKALQIQNENNMGVFTAQYCGATFDCLVMSVKEYELSSIMKEPQTPDTSNLILSPMPGTLISYAVGDGDTVLAGQEICIVEAMKMQNVLRSTRSGVIKKCHAKVGSSLMTDETIVEFENNGD